MLEKGQGSRSLIIVGDNERSQSLVERMRKNGHSGANILGFVDEQARGKLSKDLRFLGNLQNFQQILRDNVVDEVIIALPLKSFYQKIEKMIGLCENIGIEVKLPADLFNPKIATEEISLLGGTPLICLSCGPRKKGRLWIKRSIDAILASFLLLVTSPIFLFVAILIKSTSKGPVFFKQERVKLNQRRFALLKFRSMVENAEHLKSQIEYLNELDGPVFKIKNDPRITKAGKFLRKFSLDELPQLINVLKGDMSLVGPRPPLPEEVKNYEWWQRRRLSIRPGITGLWQVSGRCKVSFDKWVKLDLQYIDNWSLKMDLIILLRTIGAVLKSDGAS
ncbi:MAG: sugar transferase [Deltaproteobacteria bacterium]|nr:sugar transferase [Deltaproteobacteria bacterium]